ncbi:MULTISPECIES: MCE family protein [Mycobacteriaceae]|uniref:Mammalian cell entry protein n=4 Tax=Mycolicibacter TaxID=1073531 RepID=A0A7I9YFI9_MYCAL|nr:MULTISPECIES: MCE family protein [Mycolicibacter]OQZ98408.1 mammalian cell entry protein [Mycolicibacter algericus DSM 45454]ORW68448.1 mammalian cell entry protein [Mycolicibacter senuensis]GFG71653.1 mammalian cell entry protein [Mycolicibacter senuensis]GFG87420.1 mammalian cell entry protein [Mycolicibacter algericus]
MKTVSRRSWQALVLLMVALTLTSCRDWRGIANVPLPGGPGSGPGSYTVYVQVPDTLALNGNSRVLVADVFVGAVDQIELKNWVATLKLKLNKDVHLPRNATAKIGQTSLLGSQHIELAAPPDPVGELKDGDTIGLNNSTSFPTIERTLAGISLLLHRGGLSDLETITTEFDAIMGGRAEQIRAFLDKLDTFIGSLNDQRDDITHAIDSTNRLLGYFSEHNDAIDRVLTDFPPLFKYFNAQQAIFINAIDGLGQMGRATNEQIAPARGDLNKVLTSMQCPARELRKASPFIPDLLQVMITAPYHVDGAFKAVRGDFINSSLVVDLTFASIDNAILTGTGFSGMLRALEQSFGHDPEKMIPDVRYTPNPASAPGGPYVERADRNC